MIRCAAGAEPDPSSLGIGRHTTEVAEQGTRLGSIALLRSNKQLRLLFIAQVVSYMGDWFAYVAITGRVQDLTGSNFLVSLLSVLEMLPYFLMSPIAGSVADRFDRRRIIIVTSLCQVLAALGMLLVRSESTVFISFISVSLIAGLAAFVAPATQAAIPNLARNADENQTATALFGAMWGVMAAVGSGLGGLFAWGFGRDAAFVANAASFIAAAVSVSLVSLPMQTERKNTGRMRPIADTIAAARFARKDKVVLALLASKTTAAIGMGVRGIIVVFAREELNGGDAGSGLLLTARGVGAALGPVIGVRFIGSSMSRLITVCAVSGIVFGLGYTCVTATHLMVFAVVGVMVAHLGAGGEWAISTLGLQLRCPDEVRGRIMAADYAVATLVLALAGLGAGALAEFASVRLALFVFAVASTIAAIVYLAMTRRLRQMLAAEGVTIASSS